MKNYEEFCDYVMQNIKGALKDGEHKKLYLRDITKNNSVMKKGLIIQTEGNNVSPTIYLDDYYQEFYHNEMELDEVLLHIASVYERSISDHLNFDLKLLKKEQVIGVLANKERNQDFLQDIPYVEAGEDFVIYFKIILPATKEGETPTITITRYLADNMKLSDEELLKLSIKNTGKLLPVDFTSMEEILFGLEETVEIEVSELTTPNMFVLSNVKRLYGSFALFYPETIQQIFDKLKSDIIILPSSIHEWIVLSYTTAFDTKKLEQMIRDVNDAELNETEILGDRPILLRRDGGDVFKQLTTNYAYSR